MFKDALKMGLAVALCATTISCGTDDGTGGAGTNAGGTGGAGGVGGAGAGGVGGAAGVAGMVSGGTGGMDGGTGGMTAGAGGMGPTGLPTWTAVYNEIIRGRGCNAGAMCHGGSGGMLNMSTADMAYAALVDVAAMGAFPGLPNCFESGLKRVVPSNAEMSLLYQKIAHTHTCGVEMPPGVMLPADQIEQVRMWIANGALQD